jgi:hypothetical protein
LYPRARISDDAHANALFGEAELVALSVGQYDAHRVNASTITGSNRILGTDLPH